MASASGKNRYLDMCGSYCALERRSEGPLVSQFGMSQHGLREVALEIAASGPSRFMSVASREGLARILRGCETKSRPIGCRARNAPALRRDFIQSSRATPVGRAGASQTDPPAAR